MKKVFGFIVVLALLLICATALADTKTSGLYTYEIKGNGTVRITGFDWKTNGNNDIYVPRMIDGYTVTEIGEMAFSSNTASLSSLIGNKVVLTIPDTITTIGKKAFFCTNIQIVQIPSSVELIGEGAFAGCLNIEEHIVQKGNNYFAVIDGVLYNKQNKELVAYPSKSSATIPDGIRVIGGYSFFGCETKISPSIFPYSITEIGNYAFANCRFVLGTAFQNQVFCNVERIGDYSFYGAVFTSEEFTSYFFDFANVEEIGNYAFYGTSIECYNDINFPKAKKMGAYAFCSCELISNKSSLNASSSYYPTITCPALTEMGEYAFAEISTRNTLSPKPNDRFISSPYYPCVWINLGASTLTEIPYRAFYKCSHLYVVNIPETCSIIGEEAFYGVNDNSAFFVKAKNQSSRIIRKGLLLNFSMDYDTGDFSYYLPKNIKKIGRGAFENARIDLVFEEESSLETIGERAFYGAVFADERIIIPNGTRSIGEDAFVNAKNLSVIYLPTSIVSIGDNLCDRTSVKLEVESGSYGAKYASNNGYITVGEENDTSWLND